MFVLYDLLFLLAAFFYLPAYLFKGKFRRPFLLRLGVLPPNLDLRRPIWLHAVSVGEAMAVKGLLKELRQAYPDKKFVISTVTATGNKIASGMAQEDDFVTYLPLDFSFVVKGVVGKVNPSLFLIAETEIWPNLITYLHAKGIPVVLVNGRISDRSFGRYLCVKSLLKPVLEKVSIFCVQSERDAKRFARLGAPKDKIRVTGNMKFDAVGYSDCKPVLERKSAQRYLVAGSTHPQEEKIILGAYRKLREEFPYLRLIIAPRHPERSGEVEKIIAESGFCPLRTSVPAAARASENCLTVFVLDTVGQLMSYYAIADIVFVGGSLIRKGGHNILEPALLNKAVLFGPYMFNFTDVADLFLSENAAVLARNQGDLEANIKYLLDNPDKMIHLGNAAKETVLKNQGATKRVLELISRLQVA